jgi:uncharacterized membrane protein (UPF0182 family)
VTYDSDSAPAGPARPFEPRSSGGPVPPRFRIGLPGLLAAGLALVVTAGVLKSIYVDYLWFQSVGFEQVFQTRITTQVLLFLIGMATAAIVIGGSVRFAWRAAPRRHEESFIPELDVRVIRRLGGLVLTVVVLILSMMLGSVASGAWETVLQWRHAVPFGDVDPQFGRDVSFFVFLLPAYERLHGWFVALLVAAAFAAGGAYGLTYALQRYQLVVTRGMRTHVSLLGGALMLLIAVGTYLGTFGFVSTPGGLVHGGMYTDINARLPVRYVIAGLAALAGLATIANAFLTSRGFRLPALALGAWGLVSIAGGAIYPALVQSLQVAPNELRREEPYIERNIDATRRAWGLDRIDAVSHPADPTVTAAELRANPETLENIRLLDPLPLTSTLNELQALRPFYRFSGIDISRYPLREGEAAADQQVLISARELDLTRVADRNWTRDRLQLTHGFGAIATPVTEVQSEGLPRLTLRDIPPRAEHSRLGLSEDGARIYFGELTSHYVIVNSHELEFDYPDPQADGRDVRTSYAHDRGIALSSLFRRGLLAWELGDLNVLISGQIHNESRLLLHRQIQDRARKLAPFLRLDSDPYVAVIDGGLKWIQPAYTATSRYPYAQPDGGINYVRNSVQIVIDSSTGDVDFYLVDAEDPVARTMSRMFPSLFVPGNEMPAEVRQQLRYPLDMFRVQAGLYRQYHVTSAEVFFLGEDFWEIPVQRVRGSTRAMEPYYVTMRLPEEDTVEFALIMPFTPRDRENTVAWLAGRSDGEQFGRMRNFRFPAGVLAFGPSQVENRIEQNATISQQLTLWNSSGSEVLRSTLMMIPVGNSFLYVQPVYLQAAGGRMPELRRVIAANGNIVAMEETFERALQMVMADRAPGDSGLAPAAPAGAAPPASSSAAPVVSLNELQRLLQQARQSSDTTQAELERLRGLLDQIERAIPRSGQ